MAEERTMTLNLTDEEMGLLDELSTRHDMSKTAILRKTLRMYQVIDTRLRKGEKLFTEAQLEQKKAELLVLSELSPPLRSEKGRAV